jgi:hypothetical protein
MRRWKLLAALAGLAVLVAVGAVALRPRPQRITRESFNRIEKGMTRAEVEAILGPWRRQSWDCRTGPTRQDLAAETFADPEVQAGGCQLVWASETVWIALRFDTSWRVDRRRKWPSVREDQGALDNLRWRAERQWREWFP